MVDCSPSFATAENISQRLTGVALTQAKGAETTSFMQGIDALDLCEGNSNNVQMSLLLPETKHVINTSYFAGDVQA